MGQGQMLIGIAAIVMLSKLVLSGNNLMSTGEDMFLASQAIVEATTVGQSMIERITTRSFDNSIAAHGSPDSLSFAAIGRDAGEVDGADSTFNDIDDYNGYTQTVQSPKFGPMVVTCSVFFVRSTAPHDSLGSKTFMKRINVRVDNTFMVDHTGQDPVKLSGPLLLSQLVAYE